MSFRIKQSWFEENQLSFSETTFLLKKSKLCFNDKPVAFLKSGNHSPFNKVGSKKIGCRLAKPHFYAKKCCFPGLRRASYALTTNQLHF